MKAPQSVSLATRKESGQRLLVVGVLLFGVFAWSVAWSWPTAVQIASIWWRSDTFAHGLVVIPIFAWLVWRARERIASIQVQPTLWMIVPIGLVGSGWLLGEMINLRGLAHFSLVGLIVATSIGVLGWRLSRVLAFPLLFLFFGVPFGEFLMPVLMDYTADVAVMALRASGVPVYQEGLFFIVPNGRWSVVEACSGIRYLIASVMVGTLYAYLNYRSLSRRLLFVGVAIVVPIVANWVRAYLIVMLGYLSDNRIAAGVDHLIYGWVFFGVVILLMFWIGSRWREDVEEAPVSGSGAFVVAGTERVSSGYGWVAILAFAGVAILFPFLQQQIDRSVAPFEVVLQAPEPAAGWSRIAGTAYDNLPAYSGYRGRFEQQYRHESGATVSLVVAYYARQREDAELVAWANRVVPRSGSSWSMITEGIDDMPSGKVRRTLVGDGVRRVAVWHWYRSNSRTLVSDKVAKALLAVNRLTAQPDDAAFVAVLVPVEERPQEVRPLVEAFLEAHWPALESTLENAKTRR